MILCDFSDGTLDASHVQIKITYIYVFLCDVVWLCVILPDCLNVWLCERCLSTLEFFWRICRYLKLPKPTTNGWDINDWRNYVKKIQQMAAPKLRSKMLYFRIWKHLLVNLVQRNTVEDSVVIIDLKLYWVSLYPQIYLFIYAMAP